MAALPTIAKLGASTTYTSGTALVSDTVTPTTGDLLVVAVTISGDAAATGSRASTDISTTTGSGWSWTLVQSAPAAASRSATYVFYSRVPAGTSAGTFTVTAGGSVAAARVAVVKMSGVHPSQPVFSSAIRTHNTSTSSSVTLSPGLWGPTDMAFGVISSRDDINGMTVGLGFVALHNEYSGSTPSAAQLIEYRNNGSFSTTVGYSGANTVSNTGVALVVRGTPYKMDTFTDTFNTVLDKSVGHWEYSMAGVVWDSSGQARIPCTSGYNSMATNSDTGPVLDLTNSALLAKVTLPSLGNGTRESFMEYGKMNANNTTEQMFVSGADLCARETINGSITYSQSVTYDPTAHAWWRMSESGGTISWAVSPNGTTWTTLWSTTPGFPLDCGWIAFSSGYYGTESASNAYIDNVNVPAVPFSTYGNAQTNLASSSVTTVTLSSVKGSAPISVSSLSNTKGIWSLSGSAPLSVGSSSRAAWRTSGSAPLDLSSASSTKEAVHGSGPLSLASGSLARLVVPTIGSAPLSMASGSSAWRLLPAVGSASLSVESRSFASDFVPLATGSAPLNIESGSSNIFVDVFFTTGDASFNLYSSSFGASNLHTVFPNTIVSELGTYDDGQDIEVGNLFYTFGGTEGWCVGARMYIKESDWTLWPTEVTFQLSTDLLDLSTAPLRSAVGTVTGPGWVAATWDVPYHMTSGDPVVISYQTGVSHKYAAVLNLPDLLVAEDGYQLALSKVHDGNGTLTWDRAIFRYGTGLTQVASVNIWYGADPIVSDVLPDSLIYPRTGSSPLALESGSSSSVALTGSAPLDLTSASQAIALDLATGSALLILSSTSLALGINLLAGSAPLSLFSSSRGIPVVSRYSSAPYTLKTANKRSAVTHRPLGAFLDPPVIWSIVIDTYDESSADLVEAHR